ncbi:MAG: hypothetical protein RLZZ324_147, partial [Candidatus Parcubacteria bacterium]
YRKNFGPALNITVEVQDGIKVFATREILEEIVDDHTQIGLDAARKINPEVNVGDLVMVEVTPDRFGRIAAQTAKQVIIQKIREAERNKMFGEFKDREHELINATVQRRDGKVVLIDLGKATAVLPPEEQIPTERYNSGDRVKVYVTDVRMSTRGPEVVVSRAHPDIVRKVFALEIPEVASGVVEIHNIAREAGSRSKVSVSTAQENIDPIGSCIGQRGTRIQTIIAELGGEKVDIIPFDEDAVRYITNALSPAKVTAVDLDTAARSANVTVPEDQLSLAIGKGGQNVRLASRLTGWRINIRDGVARGGEVVEVASESDDAPSTDNGAETPDAEAAAKDSTEEAA